MCQSMVHVSNGNKSITIVDFKVTPYSKAKLSKELALQDNCRNTAKASLPVIVGDFTLVGYGHE